MIVLLVEDHIDSKTKQLYADHITQNSQNLLKLIDQIFHLSIIETGKVRIQNKELKIADIIKSFETVLTEKVTHSNKHIKLSLNIENQDYIINTDPEKLKLILENLFDNAMKYTTTGIIEMSFLRMEKEEPVQPVPIFHRELEQKTLEFDSSQI